MPQFAARIAKITPPDQRVFVFGAEPELLFYAQPVSATRYIFLFPLYGPYRNVREKQIAAAAEIEGAAPAAVVYVPNDLFSVRRAINTSPNGACPTSRKAFPRTRG